MTETYSPRSFSRLSQITRVDLMKAARSHATMGSSWEIMQLGVAFDFAVVLVGLGIGKAPTIEALQYWLRKPAADRRKWHEYEPKDCPDNEIGVCLLAASGRLRLIQGMPVHQRELAAWMSYTPRRIGQLVSEGVLVGEGINRRHCDWLTNDSVKAWRESLRKKEAAK